MLKKLDEKFKKAFGKAFAELNLNINKINAIESPEGRYFEAPVASLSDGGCTVINQMITESVKLAPAARVTCEVKKVIPYLAIYRIAFSEDDAAKASESDSYFNYVFVPVINEAIRRYTVTFGSPQEIRFGTCFCSAEDYHNHENIFRLCDNGDVELKLFGEWASNNIVNAGETNDGKNN